MGFKPLTNLKESVPAKALGWTLGLSTIAAPDVVSDAIGLDDAHVAALHAADPKSGGEREPDIYETEAWSKFKAVLSEDQEYLVDIMQGEIAEAKQKNFTDAQLAELIEYGLNKTTPENVTSGISVLSVGFGKRSVMSIKDAKNFYDFIAPVGNFDQYVIGTGRKRVYDMTLDYFSDIEHGLLYKRVTDDFVKRKGREGDQEYRQYIWDAAVEQLRAGNIVSFKAIYNIKD